MPANGHRSVDLLRRAACESRCREPVPHRGDLRGVRGLRLSSRHRRVAPPRLPREQQESSTAHARAWPVAEAAKALRHYDGQRPRRADLPQLGGRHGPRWTQSAVGGGHHLRRHCDRLRLPRRDPGCLVTPGCRLRDQPLHRCPSHHRGARRGGSLTGASRGLRASQRPRFAIRGSRLPEAACRAQARGLDGPPGKSLRQRQSGELHENSEGRGRVPDGLRNRRGRHGRSAALHRSRLQCSPATLSSRLPQPRPLRGSTRPAPGQNRSMTLSTERGALHTPDEIMSLMVHGYEVCSDALGANVGPSPLLTKWSDALPGTDQNLDRILKRAARRRYGLLNFWDWTSYALLLLMVVLPMGVAGASFWVIRTRSEVAQLNE